MVNNMIQQLKLFLAAILLIAMGTAFADNLPDYYPDEFQRAGILNKIDSKSRTDKCLPRHIRRRTVRHYI